MLRDSDYPLALGVLIERLNYRHSGPITTGGFQTFEVDLSEWSLSLTHATPCIWIKETDLQTQPPAQLMLSLRDVAREREWQNTIILLFIDGAADALRPYLPPTTPRSCSSSAKISDSSRRLTPIASHARYCDASGSTGTTCAL
ncbi:MAG: hypothetical protein IPH95_12945 [Candidatus Promineofilum sp.]|nr:hypothetical protein [Promineifilum sp.]